MIYLPPFRRKILAAFLRMIFLFGAFGAILIMGLFLASRSPTDMIFKNYDSIAAVQKMRQALHAIANPHYFSEKSPSDWRREFENAITFEETNITEPFEVDAATAIRGKWEEIKKKDKGAVLGDYKDLEHYLDKLVKINERGMYNIANRSIDFTKNALIISLLLFLGCAIFVMLLGDNLASRISRPLKQFAEVIQHRPVLGTKLKLPTATSLEIKVLCTEFERMWIRLSELDKINLNMLVKQKKDLEVILSSVEDAILVIDNTGIATHCNMCFQKIVELPAEIILGHRWNDLPTDNQNYLRLRELMQGILISKSIPQFEVELSSNENIVYYSVRSRTVFDDELKDLGQVFLFHDITESKQRGKIRKELIDWLSHELKTPLQSLGMATDLLKKDKNTLEENQQFLLETIAEDVLRIHGVVEEFTLFTHGNNSISLNIALVDIVRQVESWLKPFFLIAADKNITLDFHSSLKHLNVRIDKTKISWVVANLLSNAIRVSNPSTKIEIEISATDTQIHLEVRDEGPGIPQDLAAHVFEPFYQGPAGMKKHLRGLFGVGLAIAKNIIIAHNGQIEYFPRKPAGAVFRVTLPKESREDYGKT